jgi:hypothetical protein
MEHASDTYAAKPALDGDLIDIPEWFIDGSAERKELLSVVRIVAGKREHVARDCVAGVRGDKMKGGDARQARQLRRIEPKDGGPGSGIDAKYIRTVVRTKGADSNHVGPDT